MIEKIHIQNFKSIYDLELEVGRVNLFIGENGSGKSNFLEALVFVSASLLNKLDNEFLVSRGLRVPEPSLIKSAFEHTSQDKIIEILLTHDNNLKTNFKLDNENTNYSKWMRLRKDSIKDELELDKLLQQALEGHELKEEERKELFSYLNKNSLNAITVEYVDFLIYSPENTSLRTFEKEGQIQPLGINGEGLLKLLKVINNYEDKSYINTIIESLKLFNWFEDITIPTDISSQEDKVIIKDKYLYREFTQRSANEGFLFILFYITLLVAKETPKAFAIDNIDASLNPKLCTKLMKILTELAHKYDKQIFLTTHNPAILDGIDLNDEEQKLFVVSRNKKGHTRMKEITVENKPKSSSDEPLKLSEAFLRGYLGGLPKGF